MSLDRDATLKHAERLLRQGKLDGAIAEYVRLIDDQPRDWNTVNALGDLYVRAGDPRRAVEQFTRVADYLFAEGFYPRAAALYKKALKVAADHEHTLLRLAEVAARQGLLADARMYLRQLGGQRRERGDARGAAECVLRLALLDEADAAAMLAGARAAHELGEAAQAMALYKDAAAALAQRGSTTEALDTLTEAVGFYPDDTALASHVARECVLAGQPERVRPLLTRELAGADPDLLLALGRMELESGNDAEARGALTRLMSVSPASGASLMRLAGELVAAGRADGAFICADVVVEDALLASDWDRALSELRTFLSHGAHLPALVKLVDVAVDAGRDEVLRNAQRQLADAYLAAGSGDAARIIIEDLLAREPFSEADGERLRKALALSGVTEAESILAEYREAATAIQPPAADRIAAPADVRGMPAAIATPPSLDEARAPEPLEVDLSDVLAGIHPAALVLPPPSPAPVPATPEAPEATGPPVTRPQDLESVLEGIRARVVRAQSVPDAAERYERGLRHLEEGRIEDAVSELQTAARAPHFRFAASARLGRLCIARADLQAGIEWLERAAEAPAPSPDESAAVLYDLAGALERFGETARALAVLMDIDADGVAYRDVRERIDGLVRARTGGQR